MHDAQVRDDRVVHVLPKQRLALQAVQAHAVGDFDEVDLFFFRQDFVDVRVQGWVGFEDAGADGALGGGLYFGFRAGGESELHGKKCWGVVEMGGGEGDVLTLF